jgi:hypothetical protein
MLVFSSDLSYSDLENLWKGIVKVDHSLVSSTHPSHEYGDYTVITIKDSRYGIEDNAQFDNFDGLAGFPNEIVFFIKGNEFLERMLCTAVKGYKEERSKKLLRSYDVYKSVACKGFILEPAKEDDTLDVDACLALVQFDNEYGQDVSIERLGIHAFASGSQTSNMTLRDPRRSVTTTFVASKDKPFVAYIYLRDKTLKFFCDDSGPKIYHVREKRREEKQSPTTKNKSIDILKTRLASGEITIEEYERLRSIILEDENHSSSWV